MVDKHKTQGMPWAMFSQALQAAIITANGKYQ